MSPQAVWRVACSSVNACRISLVTADTVPEVLALPHRVPSLGRAVEQFLTAKPLSANGRRSYAHGGGLDAVVGDLGADLALAGFTAERVRRVLEDYRWGNASAATWNSRLTAVGSFRRWVQAQGWVTEDPLAGIERRPSRARRHHAGPLRAAARPLDPAGCSCAGEDPVADAVRNRGPHQRGSGPQH